MEADSNRNLSINNAERRCTSTSSPRHLLWIKKSHVSHEHYRTWHFCWQAQMMMNVCGCAVKRLHIQSACPAWFFFPFRRGFHALVQCGEVSKCQKYYTSAVWDRLQERVRPFTMLRSFNYPKLLFMISWILMGTLRRSVIRHQCINRSVYS